MTKTAQHSADNPRDWNPNDPMLKSPLAPHESAAVLRMHRAGHKGADTMRILKMRGTALIKQLERALSQENNAAGAGRKIHDASIDPRLLAE